MADEDLQRQYDRSVAEYRFQVELNWRRSEYFFVLNIGVLVAASTLLASHKVPRLLVAAVFAVGAILAVLSILANKTQHGYYRSARDLKRRLERKIHLDAAEALATTPGMGSRLARLGKVGTFLTIMLVAIAVVDVLGVVLVAHEASADDSGFRRVVVRLDGGSSTSETLPPAGGLVVIAKDGHVVVAREANSVGMFPSVDLEPGDYEIWSGSPKPCKREIVIGVEPLQIINAYC